MKLFHFFLIIILLTNCSFDNKTGIWKNENLKKNLKSLEYVNFIILRCNIFTCFYGHLLILNLLNCIILFFNFR